MNQQDKNPWNSIGSLSVNDVRTPARTPLEPTPVAPAAPTPAAPAAPTPVAPTPAAPTPAVPANQTATPPQGLDLPPVPVAAPVDAPAPMDESRSNVAGASQNAAGASRVDLPPLPMDECAAPRPDLVIEPSFEQPPTPPTAPVAPAVPASAPVPPAGSVPPAAPGPVPPAGSVPPAAPAPAAPAPAAPVAPATFPPAANMPRPAERKTGILPLVLGIASILLCFLPIVSTIMGVAAIVLTVRAGRRGEYSGMLTAGKVTGIIGTVLSIIALIMTILSLSLASRMYNMLDAQSELDGPGQGYTAEEFDAWEAVEERMDALVGQNPEDAAVIAGYLSQHLDQDPELAPYMQGCDPNLYATWAVLGLEYEDQGVFVAEDEGYATVYVSLRDSLELLDRWTSLLDQAAEDPNLADTTDEEFSQIFRDTYLKALAASDETYETTLILDLQRDTEGTWSVTDESWDEALEYLFSL